MIIRKIFVVIQKVGRILEMFKDRQWGFSRDDLKIDISVDISMNTYYIFNHDTPNGLLS